MGDAVTLTLVVLAAIVAGFLTRLRRIIREHERARDEIRRTYGFSEWWGRR